MVVTAPALAERLQDPRHRLTPADVRLQTGADAPGLYAWFVDEAGAGDLEAGLDRRVEPGLFYAGQAGAGRSSATLGSRLLGNHIGGNTYGSTLRLTLAAALRARLDLTPGEARRRMDPGESRLTAWMTDHLQLAIAAYPDRAGLDAIETAVLALLDPPFNLAKRPPTALRRRLTELRGAFVGPRAAQGARGPVASLASRVKNAPATGPTPEALARELGLPNGRSIRAFLRRRYPRPAAELWSRWGPLSPEMEAAVRHQFGRAHGSGGAHPPLRAVGLVPVSYGDETVEQGALTWTGSDWAVTGDAGWLLTDFYAILPQRDGAPQSASVGRSRLLVRRLGVDVRHALRCSALRHQPRVP